MIRCVPGLIAMQFRTNYRTHDRIHNIRPVIVIIVRAL